MGFTMFATDAVLTQETGSEDYDVCILNKIKQEVCSVDECRLEY